MIKSQRSFLLKLAEVFPEHKDAILNEQDFRALTSPKQAEKLLGFVRINRTLDYTHISLLASDIRSGKWRRGDSSICFHKDGWLANGQHRLWAEILVGTPIFLDYRLGLEEDDVCNAVDGIRQRTLSQRALFSAEFGAINERDTRIGNAILTEGTNRQTKASKTERLEFIKRYLPQIRYIADDLFKGSPRFLSSSIIPAVFFRVYLHVGKDEYTTLEKLKEAADYLINPANIPNSEAIQTLVTMNRQFTEDAATRPPRRITYKQMLYLLWSYMRGISLKQARENFPAKLQPWSETIYPQKLDIKYAEAIDVPIPFILSLRKICEGITSKENLSGTDIGKRLSEAGYVPKSKIKTIEKASARTFADFYRKQKALKGGKFIKFEEFEIYGVESGKSGRILSYTIVRTQDAS